MTMTVRVTNQDLLSARDEGTVIVVTGTDTETRDRVTFAGDRRVMDSLAEAVIMSEDGVPAEVEDYQVLSRTPLRRAVVHAADEASAIRLAKTVAKYLPANYRVASVTGSVVTIEGHDHAGWTLDEYVIPRLGSGLIAASECGVSPDDATYRRFRSAHRLPEDPWTPGAHERALRHSPEAHWTTAGVLRGGQVINDLGGQPEAPRFGADENDLDEEV